MKYEIGDMLDTKKFDDEDKWELWIFAKNEKGVEYRFTYEDSRMDNKKPVYIGKLYMKVNDRLVECTNPPNDHKAIADQLLERTENIRRLPGLFGDKYSNFCDPE